DELPCLVRAEVRQDEVGPLVVETEKRVLVRRKTEEVVPLLDPLRNRVVDRTLAVDELVLVLERLAADAVEPCVHVLVDIAAVVNALQEFLDELLVSLVRRADEEVGMRADPTRELLPVRHDLICVDLRLEPLVRGNARHLGGMLVRAGQEERLVAALTAMAH